mgnify:CR=1 FL=1
MYGILFKSISPAIIEFVIKKDKLYNIIFDLNINANGVINLDNNNIKRNIIIVLIIARI